jgi:hypothetical protein
MAVFSLITTIVLAIYLMHAFYDLPLVYFVQSCANHEWKQKPILSSVFLQIPNFCNVLTLLTDIKKNYRVILPPNSNILHGLGSIFVSFLKQKKGIFSLFTEIFY